MPLISVIVPTRLRNHLLPRALRSLLAQTLQDLEILVVDDNPPEARLSSDPALAPWLQDARVRVLVHEQPRNAAAARNVGLRAARGEWITFLDDDDAYQPAKLEKQREYARQSGMPLGICGVTFHLAHRQRLWLLPGDELGGSELLLQPLALPSIFHRNAERILFDEGLSAGEDAHYFFRLVAHFGVKRIFNVPESLVDVYPQPGPRVNANAEGLWQAALAIHREFAPAYGAHAAEAFLARARLGYLKLKPGELQETTKVAWRLWRLRGRKELRFIMNALLFKVPWARRLLVS